MSFGMGQTPDLSGERERKPDRAQRGAESRKEHKQSVLVPKLIPDLKTQVTDLTGLRNSSLSPFRLKYQYK